MLWYRKLWRAASQQVWGCLPLNLICGACCRPPLLLQAARLQACQQLLPRLLPRPAGCAQGAPADGG